ncbi:MAG: nitrile hydratase subunit beta [Gemmatimonadetes bacterium]|jgi:hypothetical protein|nr:nitrile hydratase subunit beta [Gemmatimonadota bacterium]MBT7862000.1 nitrile hydratase subunit beta [Gemmatimonadota bacterium]
MSDAHDHPGHRIHDMGGDDAGPIDRADVVYAPWEKRVKALLGVLVHEGVMSLDELRRGIEDLGEADYERLGYYERWTHSIAQTMVQHGHLTIDELGRQMEKVETTWREEGREPATGTDNEWRRGIAPPRDAS